MEKEYIIEMVDGGITFIDSEGEFTRGCPTCDYDSEYINRIFFNTTQYRYTIEIINEYDYGLSIADMIKILFDGLQDINKMQEKEFGEWISEQIEGRCSPDRIELDQEEVQE